MTRRWDSDTLIQGEKITMEQLLKDLKDAEWSIQYHTKKLREANRVAASINAELEALKDSEATKSEENDFPL